MMRQYLLALAGLFAAVAVLYPYFTSQQAPIQAQIGKQNTVLFLSNSEYGLANVLLATANTLLVNYPDIEVHYASFPKRERDVTSLSGLALERNPAASPMVFHHLSPPTYSDALTSRGHMVQEAMHPPGMVGARKLNNDMQKYLMPWNASEYLNIYHDALRIIDEVDPAVVAVDGLLGPGLDAVKARNRNHAVIAPNALRDSFAQIQPYGAMFWKYPALASGFPYPVPWSKIPANIWLNLRFIYSVLVTPELSEKKKYLESQGLAKPNDFYNIYSEHMTWITSSTPEIDFPLAIVPDNVKSCGPIYLVPASAERQDPELASWLAKAPTLLINLGSLTDYDEIRAVEMAKAVQVVLDKTNVQVLWKFNKRIYSDGRDTFSADFLGPLKHNPRLRLEKWISIDPAAMMETGNIVASVHHGGANCYHEAIG
jgi:hypothetical protein